MINLFPSNINFFGLVFTFVVASTIIILDLALLRFLEYFSRYKHGLAPRINRWVQDGVFQLIRRAHDAQGHGVWKGLSHDVPITAEKCLLPDLELDTLIVVPSTPSTPVTFISKHRSSSVNSTPEQILKPHMTTMSEKTLAGDDEMDLEVTFKLDQGPSWEEGGQVAQEKQQQDNWFWKSGKDYGFDDITPIEDVNREWLGSSRDGSS